MDGWIYAHYILYIYEEFMDSKRIHTQQFFSFCFSFFSSTLKLLLINLLSPLLKISNAWSTPGKIITEIYP